MAWVTLKPYLEREGAPKLLDLFCGEGGCSMGYHRAGFDVTGVDSVGMKRYPFKFVNKSVFELDSEWVAQFDVIAASPPCKTHTSLKAFSGAHHVDLIPQTRDMLRKSGKPYVIENVMGAPLINPVMLCGSMFPELMVERHRIFESNVDLEVPVCEHEAQRKRHGDGWVYYRYHSGVPVPHTTHVITVAGRGFGMGEGEVDLWRDAMGMEWASREGLREAIPPAYTEFIGKQILALL